MERVCTLLAVADGNSSFVLAEAAVVLPTSLRAVKRGWVDHNMYLPGSPKMREHMMPRTVAVAKVSEFPPISPSINQLTSVFNCPAGMSTIWRAEIFPSLPPILTLRLSPVPFISSLFIFQSVASHLSRQTMPAPLTQRKIACVQKSTRGCLK